MKRNISISLPGNLATEIRQAAGQARQWMLEKSFDFWADRCVNPDGGFFERVDLAGQPITGEDSRVRLQARMAFSFALAAKLGWDTERARQLTQRGIETLIRDCCRGDGLYGRRVLPGSGLTDDGAETYDTAFALLAFATAYEVFKLPNALGAGQALSASIERELKRPGGEGGYAERLPKPDLREQNPHMHLTEASLAWFEATQDQAALARAEKLAAFVRGTFFDANLGLLLEFAGDGESADNHVEAGHLFEWVWILGRIRDLGGKYPAEFAQKLHDGGMKLLAGQAFVPLSQHLDGSVREDIQRTWGPTEKLKAHISLYKSQPSEALAAEILSTGQTIFADHVDGALPGAWNDRIDRDKTPLADDITPATGYHIYLALAEFIDFANGLDASQGR